MNYIKAVISDLDGTLLNGTHGLSDTTIQMVKKLEEKGILFVIATGRHFKDVLKIKERLGANPYLITANGATVCDQDGNLLYESVIPKEIVMELLALDITEDVYKNIYQNELWLMDRPSKIFDDYYQGDDFKYTLCKFEDRFEIPTNKVFFTSENNKSLIPIYEYIKAHYADVVDTTFSLPQVLEVMAKGTNKGVALSRVLERHGINLKDCMAFGDGLNDLEMLDAVGTGFIMANGDAKLKEALSHIEVIGAHDEDAVANKVSLLLAL